jgi:SAM-dependent methyltransferase
MTTMHSDILATVKTYYAGKVRKHGPTPRGVDWNSPEAQRTRFAQFVRLIDGSGSFSINDYGCGYGALVSYLREIGCSFSYCGFDVAWEMVARAQEHVRNDEGCTFVVDRALLAPADYTVASGIFNVKLDVEQEEWTAYVLRTIAELAELSRAGFAFNALTAYADEKYKREELYYADPRFLFDHCMRNYSRQVALLHDYGLYDFTILVRL